MERASQRGSTGMAGLILSALTASVVGSLWFSTSERLTYLERSALSPKAEPAAIAGAEWGKARARAGMCDASSTFGESAPFPGFESMSIEVECSEVDAGRFRIASRACTAQDCSITSGFPEGFFFAETDPIIVAAD